MPAPWESVVRVRIKGKIQGQDYNNVMHFATNQVIVDQPALNDLLAALVASMLLCFTENMTPFTSDFTIDSGEATQLHPVLSDPIEVAAAPNSVGLAGPSSVSFISTLVQIRTGVGGKKGRGRINLPPAGEANTANSEISAQSINDFGDWVACVVGKFIGIGGTSPWRLGVLSRKDLVSNPGNYNVAFREATNLILNKECAKMGSRKKGSGN